MSELCFDNKNPQDIVSQVKNSQDENLQESVQKKSAGRPLAGVWNFFNKGASVKGHCLEQCKECEAFWARAKPVDLEKHLALDCPSQNKDIIDFYTQIISNRQGDQASLSEFLESTKLTLQRENNINSALIKVFVVCNIPFHIISNPYFIDALRELQPGYQPPSRQLLADQNAHLFNNKTGKIVKTYIKSRGFFDNILDISNVLKPINNTIVCLESKTANLADCYL
ncbi:9175_t:CDS:2, partial [Cetraspora pellucida]